MAISFARGLLWRLDIHQLAPYSEAKRKRCHMAAKALAIGLVKKAIGL